MRKSTIKRKKVERKQKATTTSDLQQEEDLRKLTERQNAQSKRRNRRKLVRILSNLQKEKEAEDKEQEELLTEERIASSQQDLFFEDVGFAGERMQELASLLDKKPVAHRQTSHPSAGADLMQKFIIREDQAKAVAEFKRKLLIDVDISKLPQDREGQLAYARSMKPPPQPKTYDYT